MVRCGCASDSCSCTIIAGDGVDIFGTGSRSNPYVVTAVAPEAGGGEGGGGGSTSRLSGEIIAYGGSTAPTGWLLCQGQQVNRGVYSALFDVIGTTYGAGDGTTTFNLPNLSDRAPIGASGSKARGTQGGSSTTTLSTANLAAHAHDMSHGHAASVFGGGEHYHNEPRFNSGTDGTSHTTFRHGLGTPAVNQTDGTHSHTVSVSNVSGVTSSTGSATPVSVQNPYVAVNYLIKT